MSESRLMLSHTPTIAAQLPASIRSRRPQSRLRPLRFEPGPLTAQPAVQLFGQAVIRGEKIFDLSRGDFALNMNPVELAGCPFELPFAVFIKRDRCALAAIHGNHINRNIPQRNVINRFELALDLQNPAVRTLRDTGEKLIVATADRSRRIAESYHPLHAHQRRHISRTAGLVRRSG